jgi:hypothetical protein
VAATVFLLLVQHRLNQEFAAWQTARPVAIAVDWSRPGTVSAPFVQTCAVAHGEPLFLTSSAPGFHGVPAGRLLAGLQGTVTITDRQGRVVHAAGLAAAQAIRDEPQGPVLVGYLYPYERGEYVITVAVTAGAPALAGMDQTFYARYELCGLEAMPATVTGVLAVLTAVPAAYLSLRRLAVLLGRRGVTK